ncbi:radical SAM protein [Pseudomonas syringae pv. actinidiae]|nr:radical SAM protein [Pseudomonas syringae pv. actinidiae]
MEAKEAVGFINVTRQCNVDCNRCYLTEEHRAARERLSIPILESFLNSMFWQGRPVTLIWEGGEPSVVGHSLMKSYCDAARRVLPHARQTMVTNCFNVPNWLIDLAHTEFSSAIETTYAFSRKAALNGDEGQYQSRFLAGLDKLWGAGIECPVNVELNVETITAGPDALAGVILKSKCLIWEFDVSVDFRAFLAAPAYSAHTVPSLPLTATYRDVWSFLLELKSNWGKAFQDAGIAIGAFQQKLDQPNSQFNVACESRFFTLNPDGTVTTNPLYSDLVGTFLGNVMEGGMDRILNSHSRKLRIMADRTRVAPCKRCQHSSYCKGGPSHVPVTDGSGECAGGRELWDQLVESSYA